MIDFLKKNKLYIISFAVSFFLLFLIMNQVVLYADDFSLKIQSERTFGEILKYLLEHYVKWGGGLTPFFMIILFNLGFTTWKIFNSLLITIMFFLFANLISKDKKKFIVNYSIIWMLFYSISIYVVRESVYWMDGSVAYVLSTFELFMFVYIMYTRFIMQIHKKYDNFLVPIVALFSGWSSAQTSAITLILMILFLIYYVIWKKKKINLKLILFTLFAIGGSLIFFLSPGNGSRMDTFELFNSLNLIDKLLYRIGDVVNITFNYKQYVLFGVPFYFYLMSVLIFIVSSFTLKKKKGIVKTIISINTLNILSYVIISIINNYIQIEVLNRYLFEFKNLYDLRLNSQLSLVDFIPYVYNITFIISILVNLILIFTKEKNYICIILYLCIIGSQYSMIVAPYTPYRTCLTSIVFLILLIVKLIDYAIEEKMDLKEVSTIMLLYFNLAVSFIMYLLTNYLKDTKILKKVYIIGILPFLLYSSICYKRLYTNYRDNKIINKKNIEKLEKYSNEKSMYFLEMKDKNYAFTSIVGVKWIENDIKYYYDIPLETKFEILKEE